jgi:hypothetical protein
MAKIDTRLIDTLKVLAKKENQIKEFKRRIRVKGILIGKQFTRNKNLKITVRKEDEYYDFIVLKSHKDKFELTQEMPLNRSVYAEGIPKFRMTICTRLNILKKGVDQSKQTNLENFEK